ncbi:MAG: hypothetical protein ACRD0C_06190 [Acidimicrobiia bacterium]
MSSDAARSDEAVTREGADRSDDNNRTVLAAHPDRPATPEELRRYVEECWADRVASVPREFGRGELNAFLLDGAGPPTADDTTRLAEHPERPATPEEMRALAERLWAIYRAERDAG